MGYFLSIGGIVVLILIAALTSNNRKAINLRTVGIALFIQIGIGALVLYFPQGRSVLLASSKAIGRVIDFGKEGMNFLFAGLAGDKMFEIFGNDGFVFAIRVLSLVVFIASLISVLYYIGFMTWVVRIIGGGLRFVLGTSKAESLTAAANIFLGHTEAPLVVKPYLARMTKSELFAVLSCGAASVSGSTMLGYAALGVSLPYLIAAAFMAAPGGLLFAKLMYPQVEKFETDIVAKAVFDETPENVFDAAAVGATSGMRLAVNIGTMLMAYISIFALVNGLVGWVGGWFGYGDLSLQIAFAWLFRPLAFLMGVPWNEAGVVGALLGQKVVVTEFAAYIDFVRYLQPDAPLVLSMKTQAITTVALCGFANLATIGILIGGVGGALVPERRQEVAQMALKAVVAGTLSNLMSASIAGLFIELSGAALL